MQKRGTEPDNSNSSTTVNFFGKAFFEIKIHCTYAEGNATKMRNLLPRHARTEMLK